MLGPGNSVKDRLEGILLGLAAGDRNCHTPHPSFPS